LRSRVFERFEVAVVTGHPGGRYDKPTLPCRSVERLEKPPPARMVGENRAVATRFGATLNTVGSLRAQYPDHSNLVGQSFEVLDMRMVANDVKTPTVCRPPTPAAAVGARGENCCDLGLRQCP